MSRMKTFNTRKGNSTLAVFMARVLYSVLLLSSYVRFTLVVQNGLQPMVCCVWVNAGVPKHGRVTSGQLLAGGFPVVSLPTNHRDLGIPAVLGLHQHSPWFQPKAKRKTVYAEKNQLIFMQSNVSNLSLSLWRDSSNVTAGPWVIILWVSHSQNESKSVFIYSWPSVFGSWIFLTCAYGRGRVNFIA